MRTSSWGHFRSALAGGIVAALLIGTPMVMAGNGDYLVLGQKNNATHLTRLIDGNGVQIESSKSIPLRLSSPTGVPPLSVDQTAKVVNLNADKVDGKHASQLAVPSGAVMFFDATSCPSGWSAYAPAQGRTLVGLNPGGTLEGTKGTALSNLQSPTAASHQHAWSIYYTSGKSWKTWGGDGNLKLLVDYGNPPRDTGANTTYALAPHSTEVGSDQTYYTAQPNSSVAVNMPYLQLLACKKN